MRRREILKVKKIEALAKNLRLMLALDAKALLRVHPPETLFEHAANLVVPHGWGCDTLLLHWQDIHLLDSPVVKA